MADNLHYQSNALAEYYQAHRVCWDQFYPSEQRVLERLDIKMATKVLDVGCGCGGLGLALKQRFGVTDYTGVEINSQAVTVARAMNPEGRFLMADILDISHTDLPREGFDLVVSLSCIDWNVEFEPMLSACWNYVRPGGYFVASFRLTLGQGIADIARSYQFIRFDDRPVTGEDEVAPYVVCHARDLMRTLRAHDPASVTGYGYWGKPSATARTPYDQVCFAVLAIRKKSFPEDTEPDMLDLPVDITHALAG